MHNGFQHYLKSVCTAIRRLPRRIEWRSSCFDRDPEGVAGCEERLDAIR